MVDISVVDILKALVLSGFAGLSTGFGSLISLAIKKFRPVYLVFSLGLSVGVMMYISFVELLPESIEVNGFLLANLAFFGGMGLMMALDNLIPHQFLAEKVKVEKVDKRLWKSGLLSVVGIAIHNFPEGMAVTMVALDNLSLAIPLAVAIAIHNIPEGIAVAMPMYYATKSRRKAFWMSLFSGLTEPLGAIVGLLVLYPILSEAVVSMMLSVVAGMMVYISLDELLPTCFKQKCRCNGSVAIVGIMVGMGVMALSLYLL